MSTASFSSVLSCVRSSPRRDHEGSIGCTHTNGMPRSAASCPSTRHRCPVGSQDTVAPAKPWAAALAAAQSSAAPRSQARHRKVLRARTRESWSVTTTICFASARSIPTIAFVTGTSPRSRTSLAFRLRSPRDTPLPLATNVLLLRWDTKPAAHQEDVPTPGIDTQNDFLCRGADRSLVRIAPGTLDRRGRRWIRRGRRVLLRMALRSRPPAGALLDRRSGAGPLLSRHAYLRDASRAPSRLLSLTVVLQLRIVIDLYNGELITVLSRLLVRCALRRCE